MKPFLNPYFFLAALLFNGIGSSIMLVAFPYAQLSENSNHSQALLLQATLASGAFIGSLLWGQLVDRISQIWVTRVIILFFECLVAALITYKVLNNDFSHSLIFLLFLQQFLFPFEVIWSRIAWRELPSNQGKSNKELVHKFTITTSLISCLGPGIGAFLGRSHNLLLASLIDIFSYLPYLLICLACHLHLKPQKEVVPKSSNPTSSQLKVFFWKNPIEKSFLIITLFCSLIYQSLIVILPAFLSMLESTESYDFIIFYLISGVVAVAASGGNLNKFFPLSLQIFSFQSILVFIFLALVFFLVPSFLVRSLAYIGLTIIWIFLSKAFLERIYHVVFDGYRGRVLSIFRALNEIYYPIFAVMVSYTSKNHLSLFVSGVCVFLSIGALITFNKIHVSQKVNQL